MIFAWISSTRMNFLYPVPDGTYWYQLAWVGVGWHRLDQEKVNGANWYRVASLGPTAPIAAGLAPLASLDQLLPILTTSDQLLPILTNSYSTGNRSNNDWFTDQILEAKREISYPISLLISYCDYYERSNKEMDKLIRITYSIYWLASSDTFPFFRSDVPSVVAPWSHWIKSPFFLIR